MTFTFEAKYPGCCGACDGPFGPGDLVTYTADELIHAACVEQPADEQITYRRPAPTVPTQTVCRSCWTIHAGECM